MTVPLSHLTVSNRVLKRAQYEAFEFSIDQDSNGVRVRNTSHADPENHEYRVTVADGLPTVCSCPADSYDDGACKHRVAVAIRRPIVDAVTAAQVVTDGGRTQTTDQLPQVNEDSMEESESDLDEEDCDCTELSDGFPCWECYRSGRCDFPEKHRSD